MSLLWILPLGVCLSRPPPHRCHFPGAPPPSPKTTAVFSRGAKLFFSAFHKHTLLYFSSAVTNRGQLKNIPQKLLHLPEGGEIFVCYRAAADFKPTAENLRQALSAGFTPLGSQGALPALTALDIADNEL